jgi:hypothetical protein
MGSTQNPATITAPLLKGRQRLGPYSRTIDRGAIGQSIDGRSREGRFLRAYERMLGLHVGGSPSAVQRQLIARAARLALHIELMDDRALKAGGMADRDSRQYLAWSNCLNRALRDLGLKGAAQKPPSIADIAARIAAQKSAGEPAVA